MAEGVTTGTMRRKVEAARPQGGAGTKAAHQLLASALSLASEQSLRLALRATGGVDGTTSLDSLPDHVDDKALMMTLVTPAGDVGLAIVAAPLVTAFVERMTTGRIGNGVVAPRLPTATDAAIVTSFLDSGLERFGDSCAGHPDFNWGIGWRSGSFVDDVRRLPLLLRPGSYRLLVLGVEVTESGSRAGNLVIALPGSRGVPLTAEVGGRTSQVSDDWPERVEVVVLAAETSVTAVLARLSLPISEIMALVPGAEVTLPFEALDNVAIETLEGKVFARGRLGQSRGNRALRIVAGELHRRPGDSGTMLADRNSGPTGDSPARDPSRRPGAEQSATDGYAGTVSALPDESGLSDVEAFGTQAG